MQDEIKQLFTSIHEHQAYKQTIKLEKTLALQTVDENWPESKNINAEFTGKLDIQYTPDHHHTRHGTLKLTNSHNSKEIYLFADHSNAKEQYLGVVAPNNDTLRTYLRQN